MVENAFGILASRFRVLRNPILQNYPNAIKTVKAAVVLHNYIIQNKTESNYCNSVNLKRESDTGALTPGQWEQEGHIQNLSSLGRLAGNRSGTQDARSQRDRIANSFMTDQLAPWQFQRALRC